LGLDEGKVPSFPLLFIMFGNVIREYNFSQVGFFHSEMGEKFKLKVVDQPCA
jgi:hypothetical protein